MQNKYENFIFEDYKFNIETKRLTLSYSFDSNIKFTEEIIFDFPFIDHFDQKELDRALYSLWIMAGISYFKAVIPPKMIVKKGGLTKNQQKFFQKIYTHGLGEFFYQNDINPKGKIGFAEMSNDKLQMTNQGGLNRKQKIDNHHSVFAASLIPLGGGKDSLTTIELLKAQGLDFETITVDSDARFQAVSKIIGKPHIEIKRKISPKLIQLNKEGALNGHVPISSIWAFIFVITAILKGKQNIILSNEHSANEATTEYMGMPINHQYSKTLEFEQDLQAYIAENISPNIHYFSLLRPLTELNIAQIFCSEIFDKYKDNFSSCNRNFRISEKFEVQHSKLKKEEEDCHAPLRSNCDDKYKKKINTKSSTFDTFSWCSKCPKCAFVFTIFAPFLSKKELIKLFDHNLFTDPTLTETFHELLGLTDHKPFECVGEVMEVRKAMIMAREKFPEIKKFLVKLSAKAIEEADSFDYQKLHTSSMPNEFYKSLGSILSQPNLSKSRS